ncbi:chromate efflux transporter [Litoribacillus peritrichatus]|uniref:chromate efflux transporter n=1 Tax=Litoribacillus peritrichatus TaxID=718191 RepID=UPI0031E2AAC3
MIFFKLGCTSFGGPVAHLGYFHREFVQQRKWFTEVEYTELLALCHFLPGPASSQVGMAIGYRQQGVLGSLIAFVGFTLPSVLLMVMAALLLQSSALTETLNGVLHAMKLLAVAVVADAVWGMAKKICITRVKTAITLITAVTMLVVPGLSSQLTVIFLAGLVGAVFLAQSGSSVQPLVEKGSSWLSPVCLVVFAGLLLGLPWLASYSPSLELVDTFYRAGGLVFGGGHVVLPMLQAEPLVQSAISSEQFLTAYSFAQAVPGPMFTIASYLGVAYQGSWMDGLIATAAIFLPGWLIVIATLSLWPKIKSISLLSGAMQGVVAATVGLLVAALYQPVFVSAVLSPSDMAIVLSVWALLCIAKLPVWSVVIAVATFGGVFL